MIASILLQAAITSADSTLTQISISTGDQLSNIEYVVICVWSALMFAFLALLAKRYTFGDWTKETPNPYADETLGMPRGTMRGVITLTLLFFTVIIELHVIRNPLMEYWTDKYITSFQMVLAFYFGSQVMNYVSKKDFQKTQVMEGQEPTVDNQGASKPPEG